MRHIVALALVRGSKRAAGDVTVRGQAAYNATKIKLTPFSSLLCMLPATVNT